MTHTIKRDKYKFSWQNDDTLQGKFNLSTSLKTYIHAYFVYYSTSRVQYIIYISKTIKFCISFDCNKVVANNKKLFDCSLVKQNKHNKKKLNIQFVL